MSLRSLFERYLQVKRASLQGLGAEFVPPPSYVLYTEAVSRGEAVVRDPDPNRSIFDKVNELDAVVEILHQADKVTADPTMISAIKTKLDFFTKARASLRKALKTGPPLSVPTQRIVLLTLLNDFKRLSRLWKTDRAKIANKSARQHLMKEMLEERKQEALKELLTRNPFMTEQAQTKFLKTASFQMSEDEKSKFKAGADIFLIDSKLKSLDAEVEKMTRLDPVEGHKFRGLVEAIKQALF